MISKRDESFNTYINFEWTLENEIVKKNNYYIDGEDQQRPPQE